MLRSSELNTGLSVTVGEVLVFGLTITTSPSLLKPKPCLSSQIKQFSKPDKEKILFQLGLNMGNFLHLTTKLGIIKSF